jgi:secretion system chaperone SscA
MQHNNDIETLQAFLQQGGTLQALWEIPAITLEHLYGYAYQLFNNQQYERATHYFSLLCHLSHWQYEYWLALGLCQQRLGQHAQALHCFIQAGRLRLTDPHAPYLAGISYELLGLYAQAKKAFTTAGACCGTQPEYVALKQQSLQQLTTLLAKEPTLCQP